MTIAPEDDPLSMIDWLLDEARPIALSHFRSNGLGIEAKGQTGFDPVTRADKEIETHIRNMLETHRPDDGVLGEEADDKPSRSGGSWVIDPIDGTRAFICGLPSWGILIAYNDGEAPIAGGMDQPFTGERFIGVNAGSRRESSYRLHGTEQPLRTRKTNSLSNAFVCATHPEVFRSDAEQSVHAALSRQTKMIRYGTDCYGYAMLAMGQVDIVVEAGLQAYDIQAMMPIVQGAGGIVTDWTGGDAQHGGQVLATAHEDLHEQALAAIAASA